MPGGVISDDYELLELLGKPTSKKITNNISFLSISNVLFLLPELPNIFFLINLFGLRAAPQGI